MIRFGELLDCDAMSHLSIRLKSGSTKLLRPFALVFFFNAPPTTEIYTLSLHDALPISLLRRRGGGRGELRGDRGGDRPRDLPRLRRQGPAVRRRGPTTRLVDGGGRRRVSPSGRPPDPAVRRLRALARSPCQRHPHPRREHRGPYRPPDRPSSLPPGLGRGAVAH